MSQRSSISARAWEWMLFAAVLIGTNANFLVRLERMSSCPNGNPGPSTLLRIVNNTDCAFILGLGSMRTICAHNSSSSNYTLDAYTSLDCTSEDGNPVLPPEMQIGPSCHKVFGYEVYIRVDCGYELHPSIYAVSSSSTGLSSGNSACSVKVSPFLIFSMIFLLLWSRAA